LSDPHTITWSGGPAAGASYPWGSVPAAPTCDATDDISDLASCVVSGYSTDVGNHTMTATATDNAGRTATATRAYTVDPWSIPEFFAPVDDNVLNVLKGGSTAPIKFEMFAGSVEQTSTAGMTLTQKVIQCAAVGQADTLEATATGGTSLRYDTTAGQYVYNWQSPKGAGICYAVTVRGPAGSGAVNTAYFQTK
jgi:hypothetical protein